MRHALYLAWRYLRHRRSETAVLVASVAIVLYLPAGLDVMVRRSSEALTNRAAATPLVLGAKGSPLELVLSSLYLEPDPPAPTTWAEAERVWDSRLADAVPLHVRFRARGFRVVGTTLDYFDRRGLALALGRDLAVVGDCVLGADVATRLGLGLGDTVVTSPENVFDLAGVYPLELEVVGVLERRRSPDDRAIFVDVKTAWVIEGLGHGHRDLAGAEASAPDVLARDGDTVVANASVRQHARITRENLESFHFHGDLSGFPLTAVLVFPPDERSATLLRGRYLDPDEPVQLLRAPEVIEELLDTVLTVEAFAVAIAVGLGVATVAVVTLVFVLSIRLRRRELETLHKIGAAPGRVAQVLALEIVVVLAAAGALAAAATLATARLAPVLMRALIFT